jgi:hypothetical protein
VLGRLPAQSHPTSIVAEQTRGLGCEVRNRVLGDDGGPECGSVRRSWSSRSPPRHSAAPASR